MFEYILVRESQLDDGVRRRIAGLLAGTLNDGASYRGRAWRTRPPDFRALALAGADVVGHAAAFMIDASPAVGICGLGDVAVAPEMRRRGVAGVLCAVVTAEARHHGASAVLAQTQPLRGVLAGLGYRPVTGCAYFAFVDGRRYQHPDWMAALLRPHPKPVRMAEHDF